jgi:hypothetical protein
MRIKTKVTLFFCIIAILGSLAGGIMNYSDFEDVLTDEIYDHLETTMQTRVDHILSFLNGKKVTIEILATHQELSGEELEEILIIDDRIYELFVLDSNGKIIASSDELQIGKDKSTDDYFINGKDQTYIKDAYYSETAKKKLFTISTPHAGGVLVARVGLEELGEITKDRSGLGETGEVYLINKEKKLLTPSRFFENNIMVQDVDTMNAENCLEHMELNEGEKIGHEIVETYLDYRGETVLGAHIYLPEMKWCLLTEIDEAEALNKPMKKFVIFSIVISVGIILFFTLVGFVLGKKLERKYLGGRK